MSEERQSRSVVVVCGGAECPTCGRITEALIGPCAGCCESHERTGRFLRREVTGG